VLVHALEDFRHVAAVPVAEAFSRPELADLEPLNRGAGEVGGHLFLFFDPGAFVGGGPFAEGAFPFCERGAPVIFGGGNAHMTQIGQEASGGITWGY
jgi:hypothetical protein